MFKNNAVTNQEERRIGNKELERKESSGLEIMVGKLVVIEGVDGVGKSTQYDLLKSRLEGLGYTVKGLHFPTHGVGYFGKLVDDYLSGKFGSVKEVPPKFSGFLYAGNREENSATIRSWLESGNIVLLDRYVSSAMAHQGSSIPDKKDRIKFYSWLERLEYDLNEIPKPDMVIVLNADLETIKRSIHDRGRQDIHESDPDHLRKAIDVYRELSDLFNDYWKIIRCDHSGALRKKEEIAEDVFRELDRKLKLA